MTLTLSSAHIGFSIVITSLLLVMTYFFLKRSSFFLHASKNKLSGLIFITLVYFMTSLTFSILFFNYKMSNITDELEKDLEYLQSQFSKYDHDQITQADNNYLELIELQKKWLARKKGEVIDIYTLKKNSDGVLSIIVDSETDYDNDGKYNSENESRTVIGEVYEKDLPGLKEAFLSNQFVFKDQIYTDKWGTFISALRPLADSKVSVLGVDLDAYLYIKNSLIWSFSICVLNLVGYLLFYYYLSSKHSLFLYRKTLIESRHQYEKNLKMQRHFIATISHELRTPLNGINGAVQLFDTSELSEDNKEGFTIIKQASQILSEIIGDVLDLSKIESEQLVLEKREINFFDFVTSIKLLFMKQMFHKGLKFTVELDETLHKSYFSLD